MLENNIFYSKQFFDFYCKKNESFFNYINRLEESKSILNSSYTSLKRYKIINDFLIDMKLLKPDLKLLDFWCYIWLYIRYLHYIWVKNSYWIDYSKKSIQFWKKIWIKNLYIWDITKIWNLFNNYSIDFISCLHVFEYSYIIKNWNSFIYNTLNEWYKLLKKWWYLFFSIWEWYKKFDKNLNKYIYIKWKINLDKKRIIKLWFRNINDIWRGYYVLEK